MAKFRVIEEVTTLGDGEDYETSYEDIYEGDDLAQAIRELHNFSGIGEGMEPNCSDHKGAHWVTSYGNRDGEPIARSIHWPRTTTPSSNARLCRAILSY